MISTLSESISHQIVTFICEKSGYDVIVCNTLGLIIADSAHKRIGLTHKGSKKIMTSSLDFITITNQDEHEDATGGSKEGFNIAIKADGVKIGTFGIAGKLEIVTPVAHIAAGMIVMLLRDEELKEFIREQVLTLSISIERASSAVQQTAASSEEVASISETIAQEARDGKEQLKSTANILEFIRRISKQTNLLGLNAAIEAARAGEQGRGFSVVAGEIRKLADESNRSANEISAILLKFQAIVDKIAQSSQQNSSITHEQAQANQEIAKLVDDVLKVSMDLQELASKL